MRITASDRDLAALESHLQARQPARAAAFVAALPGAVQADPRVRARLAYAHALMGQIGSALPLTIDLAARVEDDPATLDVLGNALILCHQPAKAYPVFRRAATLSPNDLGVAFNLAAAAGFVGREDEAQSLYDRILKEDPKAWAAYGARSRLKPQTAADNHIVELERALRDLRPTGPGEVQLCYALGKEYEDTGQFDLAFGYFQRGARVRRSHMRYNIADDVESLSLISEAFDAAYCAPARERIPEAGPVFILGLPRTGSTLLEQLLGRHPDVQPLGELQMFGASLVATTQRGANGGIPSKAALIAASASVAPTEIGATYLASVAPLRDDRPIFIDKLPINVLYAGAIARALPNAAIIHVHRQPADVCIAMFKTLFEEAYPFSYDLDELGRYHNAYSALVAHWRATLGPRLLEVAYEDLVAAPQTVVARLYAELGLDPDRAQQTASADASPVMTASTFQVRRPIHRDSVDSADRYARHLGPLFDRLQPPEIRA